MLQPPAPLVKVVTNNKMSETMSTERSSVLKKNRSMSAQARGKENRLEEWESEVILKYTCTCTYSICLYTRRLCQQKKIRCVTLEIVLRDSFIGTQWVVFIIKFYIPPVKLIFALLKKFNYTCRCFHNKYVCVTYFIKVESLKKKKCIFFSLTVERPSRDFEYR